MVTYMARTRKTTLFDPMPRLAVIDTREDDAQQFVSCLFAKFQGDVNGVELALEAMAAYHAKYHKIPPVLTKEQRLRLIGELSALPEQRRMHANDAAIKTALKRKVESAVTSKIAMAKKKKKTTHANPPIKLAKDLVPMAPKRAVSPLQSKLSSLLPVPKVNRILTLVKSDDGPVLTKIFDEIDDSRNKMSDFAAALASSDCSSGLVKLLRKIPSRTATDMIAVVKMYNLSDKHKFIIDMMDKYNPKRCLQAAVSIHMAGVAQFEHVIQLLSEADQFGIDILEYTIIDSKAAALIFWLTRPVGFASDELNDVGELAVLEEDSKHAKDDASSSDHDEDFASAILSIDALSRRAQTSVSGLIDYERASWRLRIKAAIDMFALFTTLKTLEIQCSYAEAGKRVGIQLNRATTLIRLGEMVSRVPKLIPALTSPKITVAPPLITMVKAGFVLSRVLAVQPALEKMWKALGI